MEDSAPITNHKLAFTFTFEEKTDTSNALDALDASSVIIESNGTESQKQDTSSISGNDADIRPIYDEEPMAEVQMTADDNVSATGQQHTEQPESNNEGEVDQNADQYYDTRPLPAKLTDNRTTELSNQLLESENVCLKKTVAQCQKDFAKLEAHCINLGLQMENNVLKSGQQSKFLKEKSNEDKVKNDVDVTETINIELEHSVAKLLAENEQLHKEKEHLKQTYKDLFDSIKRTRVQTKDQNDSLMAQLNNKSNENVDVLAQIQKKGFAIAALKNELRKLTGNSVNTKFAKPSILGKPVGQPLKNQSVVRQPTAFKSERPRISKPRFASQVDVNNDLSKPVTTHHLPKGRESAPAKPHHMIAPSSSRYSSNDIVHNHYLEEAKKKTHEHSRIPRNFSDSKHFVCSTCQKCVFNANHDACVIKFLKEVNSRAKVPSNKTTNRNKPVEQIRVATKPKRQIPKGHRFSIKKTTTVHEKTTSPRSCLRWQPTGRILKTVCLRWVPTGKTFASSTTKVESEPPNGSNADIPNQCESEQALNVSAGTLLSTGTSFNPTEEGLRAPFLNVQMMSDHNSSDLAPQRQEMSVENVSSGLVPQGQKASDYDNSDPVPPRQNVVPSAEKPDSSHQGLEFLFSPLLEEYYNPTHGQAEENNNDQAPNASFQEDEFINPFCTRIQEIGESSSRNIDNTDVHSFQPQSHDYRWTRDHPLEQVRGNPTMPVQTRRQLAMRLLWLTESRNTMITPHTLPLLKTSQCSFVSLTSSLQVYHQGTVSLQKCFSEYQGIQHDQRLKMLLVQSHNPLDT
ncbi:hypothetical protein Tco_0827706 [Tanacetum coccineum]